MKIRKDEGYSFGLGVFETIAVEKGKALFLQEHMERMEQGLKTLGISDEKMKKILNHKSIEDFLKESEFKEHGAWKISVSHENVILEIRKNPYEEADYNRGFGLCISKIRRNETSPFTYMKSLNYGDNILEKRKAKKEGYEEPVFLNTKGELAEGATTNLFFCEKWKDFNASETLWITFWSDAALGAGKL